MNDILNKKSNILKEFISLAIVAIIAITIRIFIMELYYVPTGSMKATILEKDYLFSTKYSYGYSKYSFSIPFISNDLTSKIFGFTGRILESRPQRGEVIIFRPSKDCVGINTEVMYIKRLIGLPGDKVQIIDDVIYINNHPIKRVEVGEFIDKDGMHYKKYLETLPNAVEYFSYKMQIPNNHFFKIAKSTTEAFYVPKDHYFFMGDNRDNSKDSRFELGYVPYENIIAKAQFIIFSTSYALFDEKLGALAILTDFDFTGGINRLIRWVKSIRTDRLFHNIYSIN